MTIYRGFPVPYTANTVETPLSIQHRLDYLAACYLIDEAYERFGPETAKAA